MSLAAQSCSIPERSILHHLTQRDEGYLSSDVEIEDADLVQQPNHGEGVLEVWIVVGALPVELVQHHHLDGGHHAKVHQGLRQLQKLSSIQVVVGLGLIEVCEHHCVDPFQEVDQSQAPYIISNAYIEAVNDFVSMV